ncbi:glyoxalase [Marinicauda salina]|uniref:Glyoxalase n=1 Tax=Marinicauda salina TaxID=2135793 RepID=A0A2U2BT77_9PROT|nr:VOC family protein [Marinicauda salina]PWE17215.1 glyoxalase [Marinicauda salina]
MSGAVATFEIHTSDQAASAAFYEAAFGWSFVEHAFGDAVFWEIRTGSDAGAKGRMIKRMGPPPGEGAPVMGAIITVDVADLDAAMAAGLGAGGVEALPKFALPGVGWVGYLKDPDGNVVGLFQKDEGAA